MRRRPNARAEDGTAIIFALFFLVAASLMILGLLNLSSASTVSSRVYRDNLQQRYAADAAVTQAVAALRLPANANKIQPFSPYQYYKPAGTATCPGVPAQIVANGEAVRVQCAGISGTLGQVSVLLLACPADQPADGCPGEGLLRATAIFTQQNDPTLPATATITSWSTVFDGTDTA